MYSLDKKPELDEIKAIVKILDIECLTKKIKYNPKRCLGERKKE